jgi:hypothetical protein
MLQAFQFDFGGPAEIFVVGPRNESQKILEMLWKTFLPNKVLIFSEDKDIKDLTQLVPWAEGRQSQGGKPTVYVCKNYQCQLPTTDEQKVLELIQKK